jgi:hypothetical protein
LLAPPLLKPKTTHPARAAHNGYLTKSEQKQLNKEQNKTSKQIYKDKHDEK